MATKGLQPIILSYGRDEVHYDYIRRPVAWGGSCAGPAVAVAASDRLVEAGHTAVVTESYAYLEERVRYSFKSEQQDIDRFFNAEGDNAQHAALQVGYRYTPLQDCKCIVVAFTITHLLHRERCTTACNDCMTNGRPIYRTYDTN